MSVGEELRAAPPEPPREKKLYGVYRGRVINPIDPIMMGRLMVQVPSIESLDPFPLARMATPMAGLAHGSYFLPNVGDEVLVAFENGDATSPIIVGCLWSATAFPPLPSPLPQIRVLRTPLGNQLAFSEVDGSVTIQTAPTPPAVIPAPPVPTAPYQSVRLGPDGVTITSPTTVKVLCGASTMLMMTPAGVMLSAGGSTIMISAAGVSITGPTVAVGAAADLTLVGAMVKINS